MRVLATMLFLSLVACGKKAPTAAADAPSGASASPSAALEEEAAALWAQRVDEAKLTEALAKYEAVHAADPENRLALVRLTRGWYFWGDGYTTEKEVKAERWQKAIAFGDECLALNPEYGKRIAAGDKPKDTIDVMTRADVGCMYWYSTALGKWAGTQSISTRLKHLDTVKGFIGKVEELQPDYFNYGPARYWGAYYVAVPFGKDPARSAQYFQASIDGAPWYLATRVLRAEYLHKQNRDRAAFEEDLKFVIAADPNTNPEADVGAENFREQNKAKGLLNQVDELFD